MDGLDGLFRRAEIGRCTVKSLAPCSEVVIYPSVQHTCNCNLRHRKNIRNKDWMMKIRNAFIKKTLMYFVGTLSSKMLSVLLVPIYAYFVLPAELGTYDYITSIANIAMPIFFAAIWESILRYCIKKNDGVSPEVYIANALWFFSIITVLTIITTIILCLFLVNTVAIISSAVFMIITGAVYIWQFSARALGENQRYVTAGILSSVVLIVFDLIFILFSDLNYTGLLISYFVSQIFIIVAIECKAHLLLMYSKRYVSKDILKKMLKFSLPLVVNSVSLWFYSGGNKVIIQNYIGATENGLYSFASRFSLLISLLSTVISMAVIEESYSFTTIEAYKSRMSKLIALISKVYFSMITLALPAIYILYSVAFRNNAYYSSEDYIFLLLLTALFMALSNNFGSSFQVTDNTKYIAATTIAGAVVSLGVSLLLVKSMGIFGVLIGGALGPFVMMLARAIFAKKVTGLSHNWLNSILIFGVDVGVYFILKSNKDIGIQIALFALAIVFVAYQFKIELLQFIGKIRMKYGDVK